MPAAAGGAHDRVADGQPEARARSLPGRAVKPVEQPRPFGLGDAGAAVFDGEADTAAVGPEADPDHAVRAGVAAGVVHQHPGQLVDPFWRRADQRGPGGGFRGDRRADRAEPVRAGLRQRRQVDRLVAGWRRPGVEPGQPQHVVHQMPQPHALPLDADQGVPVPGGVARGAQRHVGLGADHAQRSTQLVRGVGGELDLAAP